MSEHRRDISKFQALLGSVVLLPAELRTFHHDATRSRKEAPLKQELIRRGIASLALTAVVALEVGVLRAVDDGTITVEFDDVPGAHKPNTPSNGVPFFNPDDLEE